MDYYASRSELLEWTNQQLVLHIARLEQFATGAVFCQLVDAYFPENVVPMFKVNFYAREEYEILQNFKILQAAFTHLSITKELNVLNLIKASTVENLELLQWLYRYLRRLPQADYDAKQRRSLSVRGGTSDIPVPSCIITTFDVYGRNQDLRFPAGNSGSTWGALGLESPQAGGSAFNNMMQRMRSPRPHSAHSQGGSSGLRTSVSTLAAGRLRKAAGTPTRSGRPSRVTSEGDGGMSDVGSQYSRSSMGTQTEADAESVSRSQELPSPMGRDSPLGRDLVDSAAFGSFAMHSSGSRGRSTGGGGWAGHPRSSAGGSGVDANYGTHDGPEADAAGRHGDAESRWRTNSAGGAWPSVASEDAACGPDMADSFGALALGVESVSTISEGGARSSRPATRSSAGTADAGSSPRPATSTFMAIDDEELAVEAEEEEEEQVSPPLSPQQALVPESAAAAAATEMMDGALDTVRRSAAILRRTIPGLRRLVDILELRTVAVAAARNSGGGAADGSDGGAASVGDPSRDSSAAGAVPSSWGPESYTSRGKIRSLQDALQTLLRHTGLLLADVMAHAAARGPLASGAQKTAARAALLQAELRELDADFAQISAKMRAAINGSSGGAPLAPPGEEGEDGEPASMHQLSVEQRALSSTAQLDACLKAVGLAQFGLVQGIHREIATITALFLKEEPAVVAPAADTGDDTAAIVVRDNKASKAARASKRHARVFKLGDYSLKQLRNGDIYKGRYVANKKNGEGVYHFVNADVFEGEFKEDRMDGYGVYTFSHEGRYEGQWQNAVYSGCGTETFAKGSTYHGEYAGGLRNGWGACRFFNGDYYEGQWLKGLRDGRGMQQCTDDSNYVGDYTRGKRHGFGVYSFANGDRYVGDYAGDLPDGFGVYYFSSGQRYEGQWLQGRKHGYSVYSVEDGNRFVGQWVDGKPQWVQPLPPGVDTQGSPAGPAPSHCLPEGTDPMLRETVDLAVRAYGKAQASAQSAEERATEHWGGRGDVQRLIRDAVQRAGEAAGLAQAGRQRAQELAVKLDNAVALLQASTALDAAAPLPVAPLALDRAADQGALPASAALPVAEAEAAPLADGADVAVEVVDVAEAETVSTSAAGGLGVVAEGGEVVAEGEEEAEVVVAEGGEGLGSSEGGMMRATGADAEVVEAEEGSAARGGEVVAPAQISIQRQGEEEAEELEEEVVGRREVEVAV